MLWSGRRCSWMLLVDVQRLFKNINMFVMFVVVFHTTNSLKDLEESASHPLPLPEGAPRVIEALSNQGGRTLSIHEARGETTGLLYKREASI